MHFLHLTLLYCMLNIFSGDATLEHPASSPATVLKSCAVHAATTHVVKPAAINIIFQSKDGGQTWHDISYSLPENEAPEAFFAGESEVYLRVKDVMYRSKTDLKTPAWERETVLDPRCTSISFTRSGVMAYSHEGNLYQKIPATGTWLPVYANFKEQAVRTIFETSDGTVFFGCDNGLYKSADKGRSWKQVYNGWVMALVESDGVLVATGQLGIMRSTDNGERWEWVINEGGGIAVERIDGGFAAISSNSSSLSRRIRISFDRGKTWNAIDEGLQPSLNISSIKQIGRYLICGHPEGIFRSADMGKTWNIVHPPVDNRFTIDGKTWDRVPSIDSGKVFKIYVSGNVLYAVAGNSGC